MFSDWESKTSDFRKLSTEVTDKYLEDRFGYNNENIPEPITVEIFKVSGLRGNSSEEECSSNMFTRKRMIRLSQGRYLESNDFRWLNDFDFLATVLAKGRGGHGILGGSISEGSVLRIGLALIKVLVSMLLVSKVHTTSSEVCEHWEVSISKRFQLF